MTWAGSFFKWADIQTPAGPKGFQRGTTKPPGCQLKITREKKGGQDDPAFSLGKAPGGEGGTRERQLKITIILHVETGMHSLTSTYLRGFAPWLRCTKSWGPHGPVLRRGSCLSVLRRASGAAAGRGHFSHGLLFGILSTTRPLGQAGHSHQTRPQRPPQQSRVGQKHQPQRKAALTAPG